MQKSLIFAAVGNRISLAAKRSLRNFKFRCIEIKDFDSFAGVKFEEFDSFPEHHKNKNFYGGII